MDKKEFEKIVSGQQQAGASGPGQVHGATGAGPVDGPLDAMVDQGVRLHGVARDAALGAVVVLDGGGAVYVADLPAWPDDVSGGRVEVAGTLRRRKLAPDPVVRADGGVSHGAAGTDLVLDDAVWSHEAG